MLYIASALTPTPVSHTVKVSGLTAPGALSLVIAKPDHIEVWDVTESGLEFRATLQVWGTIIGLASITTENALPHLLLLVGPPYAFLHLVTFEDGRLICTASEALRPPTPLLRQQEFFTAVVTNGTTALVSIWTGILTVLEMEIEKVKDMKRRVPTGGGEARRLMFKQGASANINIREHNLLDLAFLPGDPSVLTFLWMSESNKITVQPRLLVPATHSFSDVAPAVDIVNPLEYPLTEGEEVDFETLPFSCPAGRNILPVGTGPLNSRLFLVIGDEHTVMYAITPGPEIGRARRSSTRRSPPPETGGVGKKRRSSASGRSVATDKEPTYRVKPVWRVRQGFGTVLASTMIENHTSGGSVLLGDECGRLTAVGWEFDGTENVQVGKVDVGTASPPTALTYIDNGYIFVSSACGDSLLVSLEMANSDVGRESLKGKGKGRVQETCDAGAWNITLLPDSHQDVVVQERWMNIAPVKDFAVVEEDDGRVSHLAIASGAGNTNSLRIVRSGAGFEDVLSVEGIVGVERMWSFPGTNPILLLSLWSSTVVISLEPEVAIVPAHSSVTSTATLAAGLTDSGHVVQVTPAHVKFFTDIAAGTGVAEFASDTEIVAGSVKGDKVVAAYRDGRVNLWDAATFEQVATWPFGTEVSAVDVNVNGAVAVSDWKGAVKVFTTGSAEPTFSFREPAYATSVLFMPDGLHVGLSDGTYVCHNLQTNTQTQSSLGSRPLALVKVDGACGGDKVFAAGVSERLSLLFHSRGHTEVSTSGEKGVVAAASVSTPTLGDCIVFANSNGLHFSRLTSLKKLQVQTIDLGVKSATRLATLPDLKLLAVGTVTQTLEPESGDILQVSGVEIRNPTTLELLATYELPPREAVTSINSVALDGKRYVAVGTAVFTSDDAAEEARLDEMSSFVNAQKGHIILFEPQLKEQGWRLKLVASKQYHGPVLDCVSIHSFIAVATPSKVSILKTGEPNEVSLMFARQDESGPWKKDHRHQDPLRLPLPLYQTGAWSYAFEAHFLAVSHSPDGDELVVGDAMRSVIVLHVDKERGTIKGDQRDMSSHAVRALAEVRDSGPGVVITDDNSNILTFRLKTEIEPAATFGLHEEVARFRLGSFGSTAPDLLRPDLLFATSTGRLGIIGELGSSATRTLDDLQRNMNRDRLSPGGITWKEYRRGGSLAIPKETLGFIDGDYVQTFVDMDASTGDDILRGASAHEHVQRLSDKGREAASRADVVRLLEGIANMH